MADKDQNKLSKAGFATPRGGAKAGYQNHVTRNGRVIVPFEKLNIAPIADYKDGFVIRLYPEQYFATARVAKKEFDKPHPKLGERIVIGNNAFILYRNYQTLEALPPLKGWQVRSLRRGGKKVEERLPGATDIGHYLLRLSAHGGKGKKYKGPPQGLFAPEYADQETNFLCKCVLAWLIVHTENSPYTTTQAEYLKLILAEERLLDDKAFEFRGVLRHGLSCCPLCLRIIDYGELHEMVRFDEGFGVDNAPGQVEGSTRSTIVNLFHLVPLTYDSISHLPANMAWGHAICNTRLGQRVCRSVGELQADGLKIGLILSEGVETIGWISKDWDIIRSPKGAVWIRVSRDLEEGIRLAK